jgi:membrane protein
MDLRSLGRGLLDGFEQNDLLTYASAIAFQILTAIVPFLLFLLGLLGFLDLGEVWDDDLAPDVEPRVSDATFELLDDTVREVLENRQLFWLTGGFLLALWQISGGVRAVMGALDGVYDTRRNRPARERYPLSIALALAVAILVASSAAVARFVPLLLGEMPALLDVAFFIGRWLVAVALLALAVGLLVHYAPGVRRPLPWVSFGTLLVIAGWVAMSVGFWVYLTRIADYDSIFGHLANLVVLMAFLYAAAVVFLAGPQIDAVVRRETELRSG